MTRPVVKTVYVGRQRTAGGANAAVEVGTVPGSRAVQMLVGWMPTGFEVAVFLQLWLTKVTGREQSCGTRTRIGHDIMQCYSTRCVVLYDRVLASTALTSFSRSTR